MCAMTRHFSVRALNATSQGTMRPLTVAPRPPPRPSAAMTGHLITPVPGKERRPPMKRLATLLILAGLAVSLGAPAFAQGGSGGLPASAHLHLPPVDHRHRWVPGLRQQPQPVTGRSRAGEEPPPSPARASLRAISRPLRDPDPHGPGHPQDGREAPVDVVLRRGPRRDAETHGGAAAPDGPSAPARAVLLDAGSDPVSDLVAPEGDKHLVEHHLVEDLVAGLAQAPGQTRGVLAGALDEIGEPGPPEGAQRGPDLDPPGPARHVGRVVVRLPLPALREVGRGGGHGPAEVLRMADERDAAVVGDVQPLVGVE